MSLMYKILAQDYLTTEYVDYGPVGANGYGYGYGASVPAGPRDVDVKAFLLSQGFSPNVFYSLDGITWEIRSLPRSTFSLKVIEDYDGSDLYIYVDYPGYNTYISKTLSSNASDWTQILAHIPGISQTFAGNAYRADETSIYATTYGGSYRFFKDGVTEPIDFRDGNPMPSIPYTDVAKTEKVSSGYITSLTGSSAERLDYLYSENDLQYELLSVNPYKYFTNEANLIGNGFSINKNDNSKILASFTNDSATSQYYVVSTDGGKSWIKATSHQEQNAVMRGALLFSISDKYVILPKLIANYGNTIASFKYFWSEDMVLWNEGVIDFTKIPGSFALSTSEYSSTLSDSSGDSLVLFYTNPNNNHSSIYTTDGLKWKNGYTFSSSRYSKVGISTITISTDRDLIGGQGTGVFVESVEPTKIYTVPDETETIISSIFVSNNKTTPTTYDLAIVPSGETLSLKNHIRWDVRLDGNDFDLIDSKITISAGDSVYLIPSSISPVAITLFGIEKNVI